MAKSWVEYEDWYLQVVDGRGRTIFNIPVMTKGRICLAWFFLVGKGYLVEAGGYRAGSVFYVVDVMLKDCSIVAQVNEPGGLILRLLNKGNFYECILDAGASSADFQIAKSVNASRTLLASEAVDISTDAREIIRFSVKGTTLMGYRDDLNSPKITVTDTAHMEGRPGMISTAGAARSSPLVAYLEPPHSSIDAEIKYFEVPITGSGKPDDPYRPELPEEIVDDPVYGKVNRLAVHWSAVIPTDEKGRPISDTCIVRVFDPPERPPYCRPYDEVFAEFRKKGLKKLDRDEAIKKTLKLDPKLRREDLRPEYGWK